MRLKCSQTLHTSNLLDSIPETPMPYWNDLPFTNSVEMPQEAIVLPPLHPLYQEVLEIGWAQHPEVVDAT